MTGDPNAPEFEPVIKRDPDLREPEQPDPVEPDAGDACDDSGDDDDTGTSDDDDEADGKRDATHHAVSMDMANK